MGDISTTLVHDGRTRTGTVYVPAGYPSQQPYPLFVLLHGGGGDDVAILNKTGFRSAADAHNFVILAPDGVEDSWNDGRGSTKAELAGVDDVGFLRAAVAKMVAEMPIDAGRVYCVGHSSGGLLALRCAIEAADVFVGVGANAASIASSVAQSGFGLQTVAVTTIHGTADPMIPFEGGQTGRNDDNGLVESAMSTAGLFFGRNGCAGPPVVESLPPTVSDGTKVKRYTWQGCSVGGAMVLNEVTKMGHQWPPTKSNVRINGKTSGNIDATAYFVAWLLGFSR